MKKSIHSQVAALLRTEGVRLDNRDAAIASLRECVASNRCIAAYEEIADTISAAKAVIDRYGHRMNCLVVVNLKHDSVGFRFDLKGASKPGDTINDGVDGMVEVLEVIV
jgi:hypothetical protein